jgi:hypothetical protein
MIERQMERPIPMPPDFVVKNGWKILAIVSASMPVPESSSFGKTPARNRSTWQADNKIVWPIRSSEH